MRPERQFPFEADAWETALAQERFQPAVVIARDPPDGYRSEARREGLDLLPQGGERKRAVDDVAEKDELVRPILGREGHEPVDGVIRRGDGQQLPAMTMRPDIPEVKIGRDERAMVGQPEYAARVEVKARGEGMAVRRVDLLEKRLGLFSVG
jgi:hypothetical protein